MMSMLQEHTKLLMTVMSQEDVSDWAAQDVIERKLLQLVAFTLDNFVVRGDCGWSLDTDVYLLKPSGQPPQA